MALAFLPVSDVTAAFKELADDDSLPYEFVPSFEVTYMGAERGCVTRRRHLDPIIPIDVWNISEKASTGMTRTNNNIEGFHNALQNLISCQHPNIWKLINAIKKAAIFAKKKS